MPQMEKQLQWLDYWEVVTRRRWILLGVLFAAGLAATAGAALWPVRYRSQALILVEQQDVPSDYVRPNVTADASERLATISQQVLSRTRLEGLIDRYHLYPASAAPADIDRRIDWMRNDIALDPVESDGNRDLTALKIEFSYGDPRTAQEVASDLTSEFINRSLQARTEESVATTDFLTTQLAQAQKDLSDRQTQLGNLKARYLGELPEQEQSNVQILSNLQAQLYAETSARDNADQQGIYLQSLASAYRRRNGSQAAAAASSDPAPLTVIDKAISDLEQRLTALQAKYTTNYPDVVQVSDQLAKWQAMRKAALAKSRQPDAAGATQPILAAAAPASDPNMSEVQSRIKATQADLAMRNRQIDALKQRIAAAENRLRLTPLREQQLAAATRDYQNARDNYESLLGKKLQSELATDLERREEGERLQVIDPASLPQQPVAPNRLEIVLGGWAVGLVAGIGLVSAEEIADETLRSDFDVRGQLPCPILAHLPILHSASEGRRYKRRRIVEIFSVVALVLASTGLGIFVCRIG